jgi:hypothetical protein
VTYFTAVSINPEETKKNVKVDNRSHDSDSDCVPIEFKAQGLPILSNIHVALCHHYCLPSIQAQEEHGRLLC